MCLFNNFTVYFCLLGGKENEKMKWRAGRTSTAGDKGEESSWTGLVKKVRISLARHTVAKVGVMLSY